MTAHTTLALTRWTCTAAHEFWHRGTPTHCPHCVAGHPCTADVNPTTTRGAK